MRCHIDKSDSFSDSPIKIIETSEILYLTANQCVRKACGTIHEI